MQKKFFTCFKTNMVYSKILQTNIPVSVTKTHSCYLPEYGHFTKYIVKDGKIPVGSIDLIDTMNGVHVEYIENMNPELYSGFSKVADQVEVEHCLKRGLSWFEIESEAALNSHALHYLRGKRFVSEADNEAVRKIIESTPVGQKFDTKKLGKIRMYMPQELIKKYLEIIKKCPLLK